MNLTESTTPSPKNGSIESQPINSEETTEQKLLLEISKELLSGTLKSTRNAMQTLQGLTGILLASYTTLLIGFGKQIGIDKIPELAAALPIVFYILSLLIGFLQIFFYKGEQIIIGDLESGFEAFEALVAAQRKQLVLPLLFSFAGLGAVVIVIMYLLG